MKLLDSMALFISIPGRRKRTLHEEDENELLALSSGLLNPRFLAKIRRELGQDEKTSTLGDRGVTV